MEPKFNALIVDPNAYSRANLWQVTLYDPNFNSVKAVSGLDDALEQLQIGFRFDVLLITSDLQTDQVRKFVPAAKQIDAGKEAAYIIVLKQTHQDAENVASSLIDGTDGFLLEPYSVDALRKVANIAARVKKKHESSRAKAAMTLLLKDVMPKLDAFAEAARKKKDAPTAEKEFRHIAASLQKLVKGHEDVYATVAGEIFQSAEPRPTKSKYKGASKRVRQLEEKS